MWAFFKRYRELIIVGTLVVLPLVVWLTNAKRGRDLSAFDRAVLSATAPIERAMSTVVFAALDRLHAFTDLQDVREQNLALRRQIVRLEGEVAALGEARAESERLREALGFAQAPPAPLLAARVIGEGLSHNLLTLKIDRGTRDGLTANMAVIAHQGVVGRVQSVGPSTATVLLLSDASALVPIRVQRSRARGTVTGQGSGEHFALTRMLRTDDIQDGDLLVTSGTDGIFPKGLPVGRVVEIERPRHGMFLSARVVPAVDLSHPDSRHEELFVVLAGSGHGDLHHEAKLIVDQP
ncbi:MAG: rod shape-determining protein MreC [Myxococcales bacterium]|nr:rod shape-determining protein MreC [Myxococcales bacterium]